MTWQITTIAEFIDRGEADLQTGPFGTQLRASDYVEKGIPVINVRNIGHGKIREEKLEYIDEETAERLKIHLLKMGDIVFGRKGSSDRHVLIDEKTEGWLQGSDCLRLRIKSDLVCNTFFSYFFDTSGHKEWMEAVCSFGATMTSLNQDIVRKIKVPLPPIETQRKIASILSAYDDLIENYQRQIGLLEAVAQEVYREWFVRGRCPYVQTQRKNEGNVVRLEELVTTQYGFTASSTEENTGVKFLRITDISGNRIDWDSVPFCEVSEEDFSKYELKAGDIVVARIGATAGYARRINKRHPKAVFASYLVRMQVRNLLHNYYVGMTVESQLFKDFINQTVGGAAQPQANAPLLTSYELRLPSDETLSAFNATVEPVLDLIENLQLQIIRLRQMRDKLLPRLMSGQLEVTSQLES